MPSQKKALCFSRKILKEIVGLQVFPSVLMSNRETHLIFTLIFIKFSNRTDDESFSLLFQEIGKLFYLTDLNLTLDQ